VSFLFTFTGWECKENPNEFVYYNFAEESVVPTVNFSLHVASSLSWRVFYRGVEVSKEKCTLLSGVPQLLSCVSTMEHLFNSLLSSKACIGNSDERFLSLISLRDGVFHDRTGMLNLHTLIIEPNQIIINCV
jgi:hypothetical protein